MSAAAAPHDATLSTFAREAVATAAASARALHEKLDAHADAGASYLALRRDLARAAPFVRARATMASEVLFGPPRSVVEAGGARLALDGALARGDAAEATRRTVQIERGLAFAGVEIARVGVPVEAGANALSDAAYELGAMLLEATPDLPAEAAAMLADDRGTLDAVALGGAAIAREIAGSGAELEALTRAAAPLRASLDGPGAATLIEGRGALAVATSALYERGPHIVDPRTGQPCTDLASATVVGPDLADADAYATVLYLMGTDGLYWLAEQPGYTGCVITNDGQLIATDAFSAYRAA